MLAGMWQPIETAPKDGTKILAFQHHPADQWAGRPSKAWDEIKVAWWTEDFTTDYKDVGEDMIQKVKRKTGEGFATGYGGSLGFGLLWIKPTHWLPIPALPPP